MLDKKSLLMKFRVMLGQRIVALSGWVNMIESQPLVSQE
jgi:hypothetical protein